MANSEAIAGVHSYVLYGEETTYNTAVSTDTHFGLITSFKSSINNNMSENRGFKGTTTGGRDVVKFTAGKLEVGFNIDFKVHGWDFMEYVLGTMTGSDPYTYTGADVPTSITVSHNIDNPGAGATDCEEVFSGCMIETVTIKSSVGEPVTCTAEVKASKLIVDTTVSGAQALPDNDVYNFTGGSIEIPGSSTIDNIIDSVEISIKNNVDILYGVGSRLGQSGLPKERSYGIKITLKYLDNDLITKALGAVTPTDTGSPTENATVILNFDSGTKGMVFTFSGVPITDFARMAELNSVIGEDISLTAKTLSAVEDRT